MSDTVAAHYAAFEQAAESFAIALGKLQGTCSDMDRQVQQLTANNNGSYANSMRAAKAQVDAGLVEMQDILRKITQVIPAAQQMYQSADATAASFFS